MKTGGNPKEKRTTHKEQSFPTTHKWDFNNVERQSTQKETQESKREADKTTVTKMTKQTIQTKIKFNAIKVWRYQRQRTTEIRPNNQM
jgi:hypothetical protein